MNGKKGPSFISKATFLHTTHSHIHDDIYIYAGKKIPKSICLEKKVSPFYFVVWFSNNQMYFLFSQKDYDNQSCIHTFIKDLLSIAAVEVNYLSLLQNASQHSSNQKSHFLDSLQTRPPTLIRLIYMKTHLAFKWLQDQASRSEFS